MQSIIISETCTCKCCGNIARLYGAVDFNKNCEEINTPHLLPYAGIPVYYYRCPECGFIFSTQFDNFSQDDFSEKIYNDEYFRVDPGFLELRPQNSAKIMAGILGDNRSLKVLDYGGGDGKAAHLLSNLGYNHVEIYDPFYAKHSAKPTTLFDCIFSFEVFEHSTTPRETLEEICSYLKPNGLIFFSTLLQPENIPQLGLNWWYIGPRNGHVSIHTSLSLQTLAKVVGFELAHAEENFHLLYREIPEWANSLLQLENLTN